MYKAVINATGILLKDTAKFNRKTGRDKISMWKFTEGYIGLKADAACLMSAVFILIGLEPAVC